MAFYNDGQMQMPVHFLQESGKGFFVQREGYALALREEMKRMITDSIPSITEDK